MGDENPSRTLGDYSKPIHEGYRNTIELPVGNNMVPLRSDTIRIDKGRSQIPRHQECKLYLSAKGEEERNDKTNETLDNTEKPTITETEILVMEAEKSNETKNKPIKKAERKEVEEVLSYRPVKYYLKHRINKKLIEGLVNNNRFNDSLSRARVRKVKGKTYNVSPRGHVYEAILKKNITKKEDIGGNFEIPCSIGGLKHVNALVDQGSDVNVMPYSTYMKLTNERPAETDIRLLLASHSYIYPLGIAEDVLVEVAEHIYPVDFVILDIKENKKRSFILGTPFLTMAKATIKFDKGTITLRSGKSKVSFHRILDPSFKIDKGVKNDIEPIAPTMTVNKLVLKWKEKIKLYMEREMKFNQWRSKSFKGNHPTLIATNEEMNDEGEVTLYLMRRSLEVLRKFHWMILGGRFNQLSHVSSPLLSKPGKLEEEKARKRGKVFNWQTATYGKIRVDDNFYDLSSVEAEFPAIVVNNDFAPQDTLQCKSQVSIPVNDEIDFRISFDESDDEDYTIICDKNSFLYKMISVNDLKVDSDNDNEKVIPSFLSPEPTVSYFNDLDYFNDFENEFPAIVYNDALTSKLDFLTKLTLKPQQIDEFDLKDETSLSECDEEEQNVLYFNDLFPFNIIRPDNLKSEKDNDDNKIDIILSF
ncbi:zinc finger, CCHC-type containing protein [Tanacetum coccineum]